MNTISLAGSKRFNEKWSIRGGVGLIYDGKFKPENAASIKVKPGGVISVGFEYLQSLGEGYRPTMDYSVFISASSTKTENPTDQSDTNYFSSDLRVGGRASWNINNKIFPYCAVRVFGGPVNWELNEVDVTGTDIHHYQVALGTAVQFESLGVFIEWAGRGEQALSFGLSCGL